jgi:hypothetical protein
MKLIMRNEPKFPKSQMFITLVKTSNYSEKMKLDTWPKQTQTKPIYSELVEPILSAGKEFKFFDAEGVSQFLQSNQFELPDPFLGQAQVLADLLQGLFVLSNK